MADRPLLTLYGRSYCHLCDDMLVALRSLREVPAFDLGYVDVDSDPQFERRFGELVPVLMAGDRELCRHYLDEAVVRAYLNKIG